MRLLAYTIFAIYSWTSFAQSCLLVSGVAGAAEASKLTQDVKEVTKPKFPIAFCRALNECSVFSEKLEFKKKQAKLVVNIPDLTKKIEEAKVKITALTKSLESLDPQKPEQLEDFVVKKNLKRALEGKSELLSNIIQAELAYKKDPKENKKPLNTYTEEEITSEEAVRLIFELSMNKIKTYQKQVKPYTEKIIKKMEELAELEAQAAPDPKAIENLKNEISSSKTLVVYMAPMLPVYENFLKDPKTVSFPGMDYVNRIYTGLEYANEDDIKQTAYKDERDQEEKDSCDDAESEYDDAVQHLSSQSAGNCHLKPEQMAVMSFYTGLGSDCLNKYLRQKNTSDKALNLLVETLNQGLQKLPSFQGLVMRGANLPSDIRAKHTVGSIVTYSSFTSTSTGEGFKNTDQFKIFSHSGKPIMGFSSSYEEYEVLFKTGTKFKVLKVDSKDGNYTFVMKEVTSGLSKEKEKQIDEKILALAKSGTEEPKAFEWVCPLKPTQLPKSLP